MDPSRAPISRRGMISLISLLSVAGCAETFQDRVAKDRYTTAIKQDPMFSWTPPGNPPREVSYRPMEGQPVADQTSGVIITYSVSDAGTIPTMIDLGHAASLANGYNGAGERDADGVRIRLVIQAETLPSGFSLLFEAPMS
jgi:hypothetical protein